MTRIEFNTNDYPDGLELIINNVIVYCYRPKIDWNKPLKITTNHGTFKVFNLGIGWKNRRLVQIEENSTHDGTLPNVFAPDPDGYVVQFDRWIVNDTT